MVDEILAAVVGMFMAHHVAVLYIESREKKHKLLKGISEK